MPLSSHQRPHFKTWHACSFHQTNPSTPTSCLPLKTMHPPHLEHCLACLSHRSNSSPSRVVRLNKGPSNCCRQRHLLTSPMVIQPVSPQANTPFFTPCFSGSLAMQPTSLNTALPTCSTTYLSSSSSAVLPDKLPSDCSVHRRLSEQHIRGVLCE